MTSGAPWSVKGIDPKAREVAKDLARRSGMTLGEWLNTMIFEEDGPEDIGSEAYFAESGRTPGERSSRNYYETPRPLAAAIRPAPLSEAPSRFEAPEHPADEIGRVTLALDRLTDRIESSEGRTGLAISGVEQSVREAIGRIESAEREQVAIASRFEGAVEEARDGQALMAERLRRVESEAAGPKSAEALRALEQALGRVANHLYEGESRTRQTLSALREKIEKAEAGGTGPTVAAIEEVAQRVGERLSVAETAAAEAFANLRSSFVGIEGRLASVETNAPTLDHKLELIAASLTSQVDTARNELTQTLQTETEGRFDRMERKLSEMANQVRLAEQRSAQSIERVGQEVLSVADSLSRRVQSSEARNEESIGQVGGEVSRIAQMVEAKLTRADAIQAEAMEKLGVEISRISERLGERIASAERRSAQAIDDVSEQVARVTEKVGQRTERSSDDLLDRIRLSEERTAKLLEDTREKIDQRLSQSHQSLSQQVAAAPMLPPGPFEGPSAFGEPEPFSSFPTMSGAQDFQNSSPSPSRTLEPGGLSDSAYQGPNAYASETVSSQPERITFDADDFKVSNSFVEAEHGADRGGSDTPTFDLTVEASSQPVSSPPEQEAYYESHRQGVSGTEGDHLQLDRDSALSTGPLSTREVIEQARAAARSAGESEGKGRKPKTGQTKADSASIPIFSIFKTRPKRRAGSTMQTALVVAGAAAAVGLSSAAFMLEEGRPRGATPTRVADAIAAFTQSHKVAASAEPSAFPATPRVAMAIAPNPATLPSPVAQPDLSDRFARAAEAVVQNQPNALIELKSVAELGHAPAQFYLGKLYEKGESGLKKDLVEARRWTERAAQGGDRRAMHNLAMAYVEGTGGTKNSTAAAQWFRRAADLGLVDSQFNLASLYEQGLGVSQNAAEAYKWYLIAAKTGDSDARKRAEQIKPQLTVDARALAERASQSFREARPNPSAAPISTADLGADAANVILAQKALSRLGYYQGPTDGGASPALKMAVAAYQRDQNVVPTGVLDSATVRRLAVFTR
jgi:localization factor PodJL